MERSVADKRTMWHGQSIKVVIDC